MTVVHFKIIIFTLIYFSEKNNCALLYIDTLNTKKRTRIFIISPNKFFHFLIQVIEFSEKQNLILIEQLNHITAVHFCNELITASLE